MNVQTLFVVTYDTLYRFSIMIHRAGDVIGNISKIAIEQKQMGRE